MANAVVMFFVTSVFAATTIKAQNAKITLPAASTQMGTALGVVAKATGTKYEVSNKYVVFSKASASAAAASGKGAVKVSGKVVDAATGEPIAGLHFA